jgi:molybdopterin-synthase adenylyltransferase
MDDATLERYSRHLLLNEFSSKAQERLLASRVLVVGAGGLGSSALLYLATSGVGHITVADGDKVERSNLQRQIIHREATVGHLKAESARQTMLAINPTIAVDALCERLSGESLIRAVSKADVVLDCSDNFPTRYALNAACHAASKPLVSGAGVRFDGQLAVFDLRSADAPCYHCVFPADLESEEDRCAVTGVFAPVVGVIGIMQAAEAIKLIAQIAEPLISRLLMFDARSSRFHSVQLKRDPGCSVCGLSIGRARGAVTDLQEKIHV